MPRKNPELQPGEKFGRLTVIRKSLLHKHCRLVCLCSCGRITTVRQSQLRVGKTKSCGCLSSELVIMRNMKHNLSHSIEHNAWLAMKGRCYNKNNSKYYRYGARGISVCPQWVNSFETFLQDLGERPQYPKHMSLGRIDNDGNYEPSNCRWETAAQQASNTSKNKPFYAKSPIGRWYGGKNRVLFAKEHGIRSAHIGSVLNKNRQHTFGWQFYLA